MSAFTAIVTDSAVKILGASGTMTTLALPSGVVATGRRARVAILNNRLIIVGATTAPIWLGPDLVLRLLAMPKPDTAPVLAPGAAGSYTGARRCKISFILKDLATGRLLAEGPLSDASNVVTFAAQKIAGSALAVAASNQPVTGRRVYLTSAGGAVYFPAFDIDDNTTTTFTTSVADAALSLVAAPDDLVSAPTDLDMITVWKNRAWGRTGRDTVAGTTAGLTYRWPNLFDVEPKGSDGSGVMGFLPRKDDLGILRRDRVWKLTGDSEDDFQMVKVVDGKGCAAIDSCLVIRDVGYFLSDDGVYTWSADGALSITDETVRPWFLTDTYFNRSLISMAFAVYDPIRHRYLLFLAAAGSTVLNRWVEFDILTGRWFGPNVCAAVTNFYSGSVAPDGNDVLRVVLGANDGFIYAFDPTASTDGAATAIDFDVTGKHHSGEPPAPDKAHAWLQPSIFTKAESGGTLTITPYLDTIAAGAGTAQTHSLLLERSRLARLGVGRLCALRFRQNTAGQAVSLYGYELPYNTLGRR